MIRSVFRLICFFSLLSILPLSAQLPVVKATMDSAQIWMGEQTAIRLEMTQNRGQHVQLPLITDTLTTGVEVLQVSPPDTVDIGNHRISVRQQVVITSFDSSLYHIPPFAYVMDKDTLLTNELSLKVIPVDVDTTQQAMFDIKGVHTPRFVLWDFLPDTPILLILLALILAIIGGIYWWRHRKPVIRQEEKETIPPYVRALEALERVKQEKLWQQGLQKEYYTEVTDILRTYIQERYGINAMEMTSGEILFFIKSNPETHGQQRPLQELLEMADFVKFAKMNPLADENELNLNRAALFVKETTPAEVTEENSKKISDTPA